MRLLAQNRQLILQKLDIYFLFLNLFFGHDFNCELALRCIMFANANLAEGSLSQLATNSIPFKNLFLIHELKFLKIVNVQSPFLFRTIRVYRLLLDKILANI